MEPEASYDDVESRDLALYLRKCALKGPKDQRSSGSAIILVLLQPFWRMMIIAIFLYTETLCLRSPLTRGSRPLDPLMPTLEQHLFLLGA